MLAGLSGRMTGFLFHIRALHYWRKLAEGDIELYLVRAQGRREEGGFSGVWDVPTCSILNPAKKVNGFSLNLVPTGFHLVPTGFLRLRSLEISLPPSPLRRAHPRNLAPTQPLHLAPIQPGRNLS